jgi:hypothetical protein
MLILPNFIAPGSGSAFPLRIRIQESQIIADQADRDTTFQLVSDPDPDTVLYPTLICSYILYPNFTFVFLPCTCVRLLYMIEMKAIWGTIKKRIYIIKLSIFCCQIGKFYQFSRVILLRIHFGSGAIRIRNYFFRIRILKVLDPVPDPQRCSEGFNEFDFFLENKEYRPFDGCKIEI